MSRRHPLLALPVLLCLALLPLRLMAQPLDLLRVAGAWVAGRATAPLVERAAERLRGEELSTQLEAELRAQLDAVRRSAGRERALATERLALVRQQLALVDRALAADDKALAQLAAEQARLDRRVDDLETRMAALEGRVDDLEGRMAQLEEAMMGECLDLRYAPAVGAEGYRVQADGGRTLHAEEVESDDLTLLLDLYLDSCTPQLTARGLVVQLSLLTRGLERDMSLYVNFKNVDTQGGGAYLTPLVRYEYPLSRPGYRLDGQVAEIFVPYAEIPFPARSDRLALALVLVHDGRVIYTLPDRPLSCVFAQRTTCRWGR